MFLTLYHILTICSLSVSIGTDYMNIVLLFETESICFYNKCATFLAVWSHCGPAADAAINLRNCVCLCALALRNVGVIVN